MGFKTIATDISKQVSVLTEPVARHSCNSDAKTGDERALSLPCGLGQREAGLGDEAVGERLSRGLCSQAQIRAAESSL